MLWYNFSMSVRPISFSVGEYYHIYSRGIEKRKIFLDESDKNRFVKLLFVSNSDSAVVLKLFQGKALEEIPRGDQIVSLGAWCLMSNHFHLLIKETRPNGISEYLHRILTGYAMFFNKKYNRQGALFQGKFGAKHLDTDEYLKYQYAYIHLNPIGLIDSGWKLKHISNKVYAQKFIDNYRYSSYQDYTGLKREESILIDKESFPKYFEKSNDFDVLLKEWMSFSGDVEGVCKI